MKAQFGVDNLLLETFGIGVQKARAPRTPEQNVLAAVKGRRTRRVRGTKGPKQRAAITLVGEPGLVVVSPTGEVLPDLVKGPVAPGVEEARTAAGPASARAPGRPRAPARASSRAAVR